MEDPLNQRSHSIIESSLTELSFIFFFILLTFSVWKISDLSESASNLQVETDSLRVEVNKLEQVLEKTGGFDKYTPGEVFEGIITAEKCRENLAAILLKKEALEEKLADYEEITEIIDEQSLVENKPYSEIVASIIQENKDTKGRIKNISKRLGNGLDHPPCWSDENGLTQYLYKVTINESSVSIEAGWPEKRMAQALANTNITSALGSYSLTRDINKATTPIYNESVKNECRHFVRINDKATSKKVFKNYLFQIEEHFYKYISRSQ